MTNVPSGSKRPWDGSVDRDTTKRPRDDSKDWRDVHLRSPRGKPSVDRRDSADRRRDDYKPRSRERDHRRDYGRDRREDRSRDRRFDRERERERDRDRDRDRDNRTRRDDSRRDDARRDDFRRRSPSNLPPANGHSDGPNGTPHVGSEKEEGE